MEKEHLFGNTCKGFRPQLGKMVGLYCCELGLDDWAKTILSSVVYVLQIARIRNSLIELVKSRWSQMSYNSEDFTEHFAWD